MPLTLSNLVLLKLSTSGLRFFLIHEAHFSAILRRASTQCRSSLLQRPNKKLWLMGVKISCHVHKNFPAHMRRQKPFSSDAALPTIQSSWYTLAPMVTGNWWISMFWSVQGTPFADICELTDVPEGSIVRTIVRLDETCRELRNAARIMGDSTLLKKMEDASNAIKRDIVFAASLYVSSSLPTVWHYSFLYTSAL